MLRLQDLAELASRYPEALTARVLPFELGGVTFGGDAPARIMGVVNLSADSWYRESVVLHASAAIERGRVLAAQGASIIDIGAESSLAHAARTDASTQKSALIPVVRDLAASGLIVSVETYHPSVTTACLQAGAKVLNLTGTVQTSDFYREVSDYGAGVIICFVEGANVREVGDRTLSDDPMPLLFEYFARQIELAERAGVQRIWIDPGLGFYYRNLNDSAVRIRHQMRTFLHTFRLRTLGWPVCQALPHAFECFEDEVRTAESFFAVLALLGRTDLLRTHEVTKVRGVWRTMGMYGPNPSQ